MPNVGIVGLGKMGVLHAGIVNALPNCKVTAICESQPLVAQVAKKIFRGATFYGNVSEMADDKAIDTVFITSPIHSHVPIIRSLLESGNRMSLFAEKPLAINGAEAFEAAELVTRCKVTNMVGFHKRFSPIFQHAKKLLEKRAIGDLQWVKCYSYTADIFGKGNGWRFRKGVGGALLDLGPHILDMLLWYFGEPEHVSAIERSFYSSEVEDYVHAIIRFKSGLIGSLDVSWSQRGYRLPELCLELQGTNGSLVVSDDCVRIQVDHAVEDVVDAGRHVFQKPSFYTSVDFLLAEPEYTLEDRYFLDLAAKSGDAEPNFSDAKKVNDFVDLIHRQAVQGAE